MTAFLRNLKINFQENAPAKTLQRLWLERILEQMQ
nr:MAG TPA: hypothetical protein [Caudoviricetes sp.]